MPPEAGYRAVGVEYVRGGKVHTAYLRSNSLPLGTAFAAERSVVLACGAVGTPQLLLASGVGSAEALSMAGVELRVRVDNVGRGLGSQPTVAVVAEIGSFPSQPGGAAAMASEWMDYIDALSACDGNSSTSDRRVSYGALGSAGFAAGAFLASPYSYYGEPDIQLTLYPSVMDPLMPRSGEAVVGSSGGQVQVTVTLLAAEATQQVLLNASSPLDGYASLEPGRLSASLRVGDIDRLVWGVQAARRVLEAEPLRPLAALELSPGSLATSQQQLREWVVRSVYVGAQRAGSTRMGSDEVHRLPPSLPHASTRNISRLISVIVSYRARWWTRSLEFGASEGFEQQARRCCLGRRAAPMEQPRMSRWRPWLRTTC